MVHCTKEFVPGLIYVAASRVKHEDNLQLYNLDSGQRLAEQDGGFSYCGENLNIE